MPAWVSGISGLFALYKFSRIVVTGALVKVGTYSLLFWAIQSVPSVVAGLINLAPTPVALFGFAILAGDEEASWRHATSLILGLTGLGLLFLDKVVTGTTDVWGWLRSYSGHCLTRLDRARWTLVPGDRGHFHRLHDLLRLARDWGQPCAGLYALCRPWSRFYRVGGARGAHWLARDIRNPSSFRRGKRRSRPGLR